MIMRRYGVKIGKLAAVAALSTAVFVADAQAKDIARGRSSSGPVT